jgi:SAM-dependent methyltransferase
MSESIRKDFPNWDTLYKSQRVETMPWYNENFDFDLEKELDERLLLLIIMAMKVKHS